jgi:hypothetical protein
MKVDCSPAVWECAVRRKPLGYDGLAAQAAPAISWHRETSAAGPG